MKFRQNTDIKKIINENISFYDVKKSIENIYGEYFKLTGITQESKAANHGTLLPSGEALTSIPAAGCVYDIFRTTKFLRGVYKAIQKQFESNDCIEILYAGTGPFASLILPLLPLFEDSKIKLVLIDYHEDSINALKKLVKELNLSNYISEYYCGDALNYQTNVRFDIIISGTMRSALYGEPQVAITLALSPFLKEQGILIPQEINVYATLTNISHELSSSRKRIRNFWFRLLKKNARYRRIRLGSAIKLKRDTYNKISLNENPFKVSQFIIPKDIGERGNLIFETEIIVFDDIVLSEEDDSGLTKIQFYKELDYLKGGEEIIFRYFISQRPQLIAEVIK